MCAVGQNIQNKILGIVLCYIASYNFQMKESVYKYFSLNDLLRLTTIPYTYDRYSPLWGVHVVVRRTVYILSNCIISVIW